MSIQESIRKYFILTITLLTIINATIVIAQEEPEVKVVKVTDKIYKFTVDAGSFLVNMIASIGEDGILLIDTGYKNYGASLRKKLLEYGKGDPKIIINTHAHRDHTQGNINFPKETIIIGQEKLRSVLQSGVYSLSEYKENALPDIGFKDSLSIFFNGEKIKLTSIPNGHDETDIIIHFIKSKVVCMGDIAYKNAFPSIDEFTGNVDKFSGVVDRAISLLPEDVIIIPGHTDVMNIEELKKFRDMLKETVAIVKKGLSEDKDYKTLIKEKILEKWDSFGKTSYTTTDAWIEAIATDLQNIYLKEKQGIISLLYKKYTNDGFDAAIKEYYRLKKDTSGKYRVLDYELSLIGFTLAERDKIKDAIKFIELEMSENPVSDFKYYNLYELAKLHKKNEDTEKAIICLKEATTLKPESKVIKKLLEKLENE